MLRSKRGLDVCLVAHLNSNINEEAYMKLFNDWATIFIENGCSNLKEIINRLNKTWSCSTNGGKSLKTSCN